MSRDATQNVGCDCVTVCGGGGGMKHNGQWVRRQRRTTSSRGFADREVASEWDQVPALLKTARDDAGNTSIVNNFSSRNLTRTKKEVLWLEVKFDTGKDGSSFIQLVNRNYKWDDSDVEKALSKGYPPAVKPWPTENVAACRAGTYYQALLTLAKDKSIVIADKGGGIVILDKSEYVRKMQELLKNDVT